MTCLTVSIFDAAFLFVFIVIYALIEIEIEGPDGWAKNLPTPKNFLFHLSLYHVYMVTLAILIICAFVYYRDTKQCLEDDEKSTMYKIRSVVSRILFMAVAFFLLQDFIWFVLNPSFTVSKYTSEHIQWHTSWFMGIPVFNYVGLAFIVLAFIISPERGDMLASAVTLVCLLVLTVLLSPLYHKFYINSH